MAWSGKLNKNIMIFGCDFFQERKTSEINFWNDIVPLFADHFKQIVILSVNNRKTSQEKILENI